MRVHRCELIERDVRGQEIEKAGLRFERHHPARFPDAVRRGQREVSPVGADVHEHVAGGEAVPGLPGVVREGKDTIGRPGIDDVRALGVECQRPSVAGRSAGTVRHAMRSSAWRACSRVRTAAGVAAITRPRWRL